MLAKESLNGYPASRRVVSRCLVQWKGDPERIWGLPSFFPSPLLLDAVPPFLVMSRSYLHGTLMEPKKLKDTALNVNVAQATESEGGVDDISLWLSSCSAVCSSLFLSKLLMHFISVCGAGKQTRGLTMWAGTLPLSYTFSQPSAETYPSLSILV